MQPLSAQNEAELEDTICIYGSGTVDVDTVSFMIIATQYINGGQSSNEIVMRGRMNNNPKWPNPAARLLQVNVVIGFTGVLQHFESYVLPNKSTTNCAVVAMKDITYLYTPHPSSTPQNTPSKKVAGNLRQKIKARAETVQNSQSSSSPST